jgi:hypothetical protein
MKYADVEVKYGSSEKAGLSKDFYLAKGEFS